MLLNLAHPGTPTSLPKPAKVVCDQMARAAARALDDDHPGLIALSTESLGSSGVALPTCEEHDHILPGRCGRLPRLTTIP